MTKKRSTLVDPLTAQEERFPLRELQDLLAPAAEEANLTEKELLDYARKVRERIWQERYACGHSPE